MRIEMPAGELVVINGTSTTMVLCGSLYQDDCGLVRVQGSASDGALVYRLTDRLFSTLRDLADGRPGAYDAALLKQLQNLGLVEDRWNEKGAWVGRVVSERGLQFLGRLPRDPLDEFAAQVVAETVHKEDAAIMGKHKNSKKSGGGHGD